MLRFSLRTPRSRRESLVHVVCGVAVLSTIGVIALADEPNNLFCWAPPSTFCNDAAGDCFYRGEGTDCWRCMDEVSVDGVCIWRPGFNCVGEGEINCGNRKKGFCNFGVCVGNTSAGQCNLVACNAAPT